MTNRKVCCWIAGGIGLLLWFAGCAVNPVTGQTQLMLLSEQAESELGKQTDTSVIEQYGAYADGNLQSYVQALGMPMAHLSHRPDLAWQFRVMDSPVVNAFAAPGGYIYVTRGLLASVNNEAELAGVIGHEIGHVTARHSAQQYSKKIFASLGLEIGQSLLGGYGEALGPLLEAGTGLLFLKFSRDDEREADALGVEYASRAGYDAGRMADFFSTLERMEGLAGEGGGRLPEFFSTHPNPVNRQANVREMARNWQSQQPGRPFRVNRDGYLRAVNGLVYGEDPRKGYRDGAWYYLPEYQVQFQIPAGWEFERSGSQAQMLKSDKKAMVLFEIGKGKTLEQAVQEFTTALQARVVQAQSAIVSGMPSQEILSVIEDQGRKAALVSRFFAKSGNVFMFHGLTSETDFARLRSELAAPAASFGALIDPEKINRQPQRLRIAVVPRVTTLNEFLQNNRVDQKLWEKIAWLNSLLLTDRLETGQQVKIIE